MLTSENTTKVLCCLSTKLSYVLPTYKKKPFQIILKRIKSKQGKLFRYLPQDNPKSYWLREITALFDPISLWLTHKSERRR